MLGSGAIVATERRKRGQLAVADLRMAYHERVRRMASHTDFKLAGRKDVAAEGEGAMLEDLRLL
jgi:hypothetical protein